MSKTDPNRTAEQIEADLVEARAEMARTVDALVEQLSPSYQIEQAKQALTDRALALPDQARAWAHDAQVKVRDTLDAARDGDEEALKQVGVAAVGAALVVSFVLFRIFRRK